MKKILFIIILALFCLGWKDPISDINKRIDELEKARIAKTDYLQRLQQEVQKTSAEIIAIQGAEIELKNLLQLDNILKDAEFVSNEELEKAKEKDEKPATDIIPLIHN